MKESPTNTSGTIKKITNKLNNSIPTIDIRQVEPETAKTQETGFARWNYKLTREENRQNLINQLPAKIRKFAELLNDGHLTSLFENGVCQQPLNLLVAAEPELRNKLAIRELLKNSIVGSQKECLDPDKVAKNIQNLLAINSEIRELVQVCKDLSIDIPNPEAIKVA